MFFNKNKNNQKTKKKKREKLLHQPHNKSFDFEKYIKNIFQYVASN